MRILIVHNKYLNAGGEEKVVENEKKLLENYYEVDVFYFQNMAGFKGLMLFLFSIWNPYSSLKIKKKIKEFRPDVVHIHNWHFAAGPIIIRTINRMGIPIVHTIHNYRLICPSATLFRNGSVFTSSVNSNFPWAAIKYGVYRNSIVQTFWLAFIVWFHKKIKTWDKIDLNIVLTNFAKDIFCNSSLGIDCSKFVVKPNFLMSDNVQLDRVAENYFVFVGRLSEEKGIQVLLQAIEATGLNIKIAGEGPLKDLVINYSSKYKNIIYLGQLEGGKVLEVLSAARALVFPSIWYEGMPMTIIEAYSRGIPVIASRLGAMCEMIQEGYNGLTFEPGNSLDLKNKIESFAGFSPELIRTMKQNAIVTFNSYYDSDKQLDYFKNIFDRVLKRDELL